MIIGIGLLVVLLVLHCLNEFRLVYLRKFSGMLNDSDIIHKKGYPKMKQEF